MKIQSRKPKERPSQLIVTNLWFVVTMITMLTDERGVHVLHQECVFACLCWVTFRQKLSLVQLLAKQPLLVFAEAFAVLNYAPLWNEWEDCSCFHAFARFGVNAALDLQTEAQKRFPLRQQQQQETNRCDKYSTVKQCMCVLKPVWKQTRNQLNLLS